MFSRTISNNKISKLTLLSLIIKFSELVNSDSGKITVKGKNIEGRYTTGTCIPLNIYCNLLIAIKIDDPSLSIKNIDVNNPPKIIEEKIAQNK